MSLIESVTVSVPVIVLDLLFSILVKLKVND